MNSVKRKGTYRTNPQSLVEVFLQKMESVEEETSNDGSIFTGTHQVTANYLASWHRATKSKSLFNFAEENLLSILHDFFGANDPANGTLVYACLWLVLHQDVQEKFYQEIVRVIGKDRLPKLTDKEK